MAHITLFDEYDVQIIGGGILGVITALLAAEQGWSVVVYRLDDADSPKADSLRNHAWLQSGLLYAGQIPPALGQRMYFSGRGLFDLVGLKPPEQRGIFQVEDPDQFSSAVKAFNLGARVQPVSDCDASQQLGNFFSRDKTYFWVPDCPFDEARIIELARDMAQSKGATFVNTPQPVRLTTCQSSSCGAVVEIDGRNIESDAIVVTAGSSIPGILNGLGLEHSLSVNQSPLLVADHCDWIKCPLYANLESGLTMVRHGKDRIVPNGRTVIGNGHRRQVSEPSFIGREVEQEAQESITNLLPRRIRNGLGRTGFRFTAGQKTEWNNESGSRIIDPWIGEFDECPGVFFGVPVKATMALAAAEDLIARVLLRIPASKLEYRPVESTASQSPIHLRPEFSYWTGTVSEHHQPEYDHLNEAIPEVDGLFEESDGIRNVVKVKKSSGGVTEIKFDHKTQVTIDQNVATPNDLKHGFRIVIPHGCQDPESGAVVRIEASSLKD